MMALWPAMNLIFDAFRLLHGVGLREDGLRFGETDFGLKVQGSCLEGCLARAMCAMSSSQTV